MKNILLITVILIVGFGCNNNSKKSQDKDFEVTVDGSSCKKKKADNIIFYNVFSPVDLDKIINQKNAYFNSSLINNVNNLINYTQSDKIALNIGIYGADLSYLWVFEQAQQAITYLSAIQHLTSKLGIPKDFVDFTRESVEQNNHNMDTISCIARDAYNATDKYLQGSDRENTSILILLGGWIETMYISTQIYNTTDPVLASKIATQKYALQSLITRMQNQQDDITIAKYLLLLKDLNQSFVVFEKQLKPGDIEIDTLKKRIVIKESANLNIAPEKLDDIKALVSKIRDYMIN